MADAWQAPSASNAFQPVFPVWFLGAEGLPLISAQAGTRVALAYSSREIGEFVAVQLRATGLKKVCLLEIPDATSLRRYAEALADQGVVHMAWNATAHATRVNAFKLSDFLDGREGERDRIGPAA